VLLETKNSIIVNKYCMGWAIIDIFERTQLLLDVSDPQAFPKERSVDKARNRSSSSYLCMGSPYALLFISPKTDWKSQLKRAGDCKVHYDLYTCNALQPFMHLFRENELIGEGEAVGGMPRHKVCSEGKQCPCDNGGSESDVKLTTSHIPLDPNLCSNANMSVFAFKLSRPTICLPPGFEDQLMRAMSQITTQNWKSRTESDYGTIIQRNLKIFVHNGRTLLHTPVTLSLDVTTSLDDIADLLPSSWTAGQEVLEFDGERVMKDIVCTTELWNDPLLAFGFELEYVFDLISASGDSSSSFALLLGWSVKSLASEDCSFDGKRLQLPMLRGPRLSLTGSRTFGWSSAEELRRLPPIVLSLGLQMRTAVLGTTTAFMSTPSKFDTVGLDYFASPMPSRMRPAPLEISPTPNGITASLQSQLALVQLPGSRGLPGTSQNLQEQQQQQLQPGTRGLASSASGDMDMGTSSDNPAGQSQASVVVGQTQTTTQHALIDRRLQEGGAVTWVRNCRR
jgi:hypothetical protein